MRASKHRAPPDHIKSYTVTSHHTNKSKNLKRAPPDTLVYVLERESQLV